MELLEQRSFELRLERQFEMYRAKVDAGKEVVKKNGNCSCWRHLPTEATMQNGEEDRTHSALLMFGQKRAGSRQMRVYVKLRGEIQKKITQEGLLWGSVG